jgi:thiamine-phosphate pyrophosphorylase
LRIESSFQLFIFTQSENFKDEEKYISQLLELGASGIYLRKNNYSAEYIFNIFKKVDRKFHQKIIIPFSFYDENNLKEFNSIIHFKEKERTSANFCKVPVDAVLSTSIHDLSEWKILSDKFKYVFYSPVFESISKLNYKPKVSLEKLSVQIKKYRSTQKKLPQLIALGGINESNILQIKDADFDGAALLGSIWKSDNPLNVFEKIKKIFV